MNYLQTAAALLLPLVIGMPAFGQFGSRQQAVPFGQRGVDPIAAIQQHTRVFAMDVARGNDKAAAQEAWVVASLYERQADYMNAATWYRTSYSKGGLGGSKGFIDLVLQGRITVDNPENIRPFMEVRAICGSRLARAYVFAQWNERPAQIPEYPNQKLTECGPAGPDDHEDGMVANAARRAREQQQLADFYKQHPDQDPNVQALQAAAGAAVLLGALVIHAAAMPASGPGSVACNRYQNHYPGAYDASVCDPPSTK